MAVARFGDSAEPAPVTAGILTGREPEIAHKLARIVEAGEVAELGDRGDRHRELHAAERLQGFDDRIKAPWLRLLEQLGLQAMQKFGAFGDGPNVLLEDDLLGRGGQHEASEPADMFGPQFARPT